MNTKQELVIKVKKLLPEARMPTQAYEGDAGWDLYSTESFLLMPSLRRVVSTGISIEIPKGYEVQIRPRSGLAIKHGITVLNSPGTIDSGYRGELGVILINHSSCQYHVQQGMKIAQMVIKEIHKVTLEEVKTLSSSEREDKGFASSGI